MMTKPQIGLKHFKADECLSYLVYDSATRTAALIDPNIELLADYLEYIARSGLDVRYVLETRTHQDHFSCSHLLASDKGAQVVQSHVSESARPSMRVRDGESLPLGALTVRCLETPGCAADSLAFLVDDLVFSGDALLAGATGRICPDSGDAELFWRSLERLLTQLPPETRVLPGHDCSGVLFSTVGRERQGNLHWQLGREEFVTMKRAERSSVPTPETLQRITFNQDQNPSKDVEGGSRELGLAPVSPDDTAEGAAPIVSLGIAKYEAKIGKRQKSTLFVDVRERDEFEKGHIPSTVNIPLSELPLHYPELKRAKQVCFSCQTGMRSAAAAKTLAYLGHPGVINVVGGFQAWVQAGYSVQGEDEK